MSEPQQWHGTTIVCVRKGDKVVIAGDGQVSAGPTILKGNARKVRQLAGGAVIVGFAGATAAAFALFERLEQKLERFRIAHADIGTANARQACQSFGRPRIISFQLLRVILRPRSTSMSS